jgi:XRN 5'-3' exonuclease N-terminus
MGINGLFPSLKQSRITGKWNKIESASILEEGDALCEDTDLDTDLNEMENEIENELNPQIEEDVKVECTELYIDFNSILYTVVSTIEDDINYLLYSIILHCLYDRDIDSKSLNIIEDMNYDFNPFDLTECLNSSDLIDSDSESSPDSSPRINVSVFDQRKICTEKRLKDFTDHCESIVSEQYVWKLIKRYLTHVMDDLITGQKVKRIFLSIDGIPNMAKIEEQKRRRNMTYIASGIRRNIYRSFKDAKNRVYPTQKRRTKTSHSGRKSNKFDSTKLFARNVKGFSFERELYETHRYMFDRSQITPTNQFMDRVVKYLESKSFETDMIENYSVLEEIKVSSHRCNNEGEKKIMADIMDRMPDKENIVIFSPDSDIIILAVLIRNMLNRTIELRESMEGDDSGADFNVSVVRYNVYDGEYTTISADSICHDIYTYVQSRTKLELSENRVTNDVCFIFTLFGNDYVPRIESIDVSNSIDLLLNSYVKVIEDSHVSRSFGTYIIYHSSGSYRINYRAFSNYVRILSEVESILFKERYMKNTYKNYRWLKSKFHQKIGTRILFPDLIRYLEMVNQTMDRVETIRKNYKLGKNMNYLIATARDRIIEEIRESLKVSDSKIRVGRENDLDCEDKIIRGYFELMVDIEGLAETDPDLSINETIDEILIRLTERTDKIEFKLNLLNHKHNVKEFYHQRMIRSKFIHPEMTITEYDEHLYMMERCFGPYSNLLRTDIRMGEFKIFAKNRYRYQTTRAKDEADSYYKTCFNVESTNEADIDQICREYLSGLFWVFNFHMNCNSQTLHSEYKSIWCYERPMAPLIFNISSYLHRTMRYNKRELNQIFNEIGTKYFVNSDRYITPLEYYLFVNPPQRVSPKVVGKNLHSDFTMIQNVTDDRFHLNQLVMDIWNGKKNLVFSRDRYLKRGALLNVAHISLEDWRSLMKVNGIVLSKYDLPKESPILNSIEQVSTFNTSGSDNNNKIFV